jgi:hypothetical protein
MFQGQLDAEISAGHHHPVEGQHDRLEIVHRLWLLQLGDHRQRTTRHLVHRAVHQVNVGRGAHE